jgi:hypothetical protein
MGTFVRVKRDGVRPFGLEWGGTGQVGLARECAKGGFMWGCRCFGENFQALQIVMVRAGGPSMTSLFIAQTQQSRGWSACADHDKDK